MQHLNVDDLMVENVLWVKVGDSLADARHIMDDADSRHVPVLDEDGWVVGVISQSDFLEAASAEMPVSLNEDWLSSFKVEAVMSSPAVTVDADQPIAVAASLMLEGKFDCLPVVEGPRLVGILTSSDFVRWVAENTAE